MIDREVTDNDLTGSFKEGDYVVVSFELPAKTKYFVAVITEAIDNDNHEVTFLHKKYNSYFSLKHTDTDIVNKTRIVSRVKEPFVNNRFKYIFETDGYEFHLE